MLQECVGFELVGGNLVKRVFEEECGLQHKRHTEPTIEEWGAYVYGRTCGVQEALDILTKSGMIFASGFPGS